jgi:microcystin-dependent protein
VDLDTIVGAVNATSDLIADANQNELVDFTATGSAVNHVGITNAATGNGPTIEAKGDDTNIDLNVSGKGTGVFKSTNADFTTPKLTNAKVITGINDTNGNELVKVTATGSAVNEITVANAATGNPPEIQATGGDTNISLKLTPKGNGGVSAGSITHATLPAGMIAPFAMSSVPSGWLVCDGSTYNSVSNTEYAALFSAIGTTWGGTGASSFKVPDLEGAFLRGTGSHGSSTMADGNAFAGPNVGSFENDQMQGHQHDIAGNTGTGRAANAASAAGSFLAGEASDTSYMYRNDSNGSFTSMVGDPVADSSNGTPRTGDETRPFNAGVKYCIKF